ncbi:MAG: phosphoribosyltransferase [Epsilonproteobacteria bacterium]|nr:phosphoribosyltransferase [Campylobacterota bacterium]
MYHYKYEEFILDVENLYNQTTSYQPDIILAVARGGVTLGHFLAERANLRTLYTLNSIHYNDTEKLKTVEISNIPNLPAHKSVLVVDDIVDSGESMQAIMKELTQRFPETTFKTGALFYKKDAIYLPDYHVK